ncbi:MAG: hypothetical protein H6617_05065 [Bdellovibrionaceae bacterium]|nr:hypothetical protein [Bdellovibrionales bacterium]MCB9254034.1 hypothetical protein [Pseudobdellovibrionaceae bacterium]
MIWKSLFVVIPFWLAASPARAITVDVSVMSAQVAPVGFNLSPSEDEAVNRRLFAKIQNLLSARGIRAKRGRPGEDSCGKRSVCNTLTLLYAPDGTQYQIVANQQKRLSRPFSLSDSLPQMLYASSWNEGSGEPLEQLERDIKNYSSGLTAVSGSRVAE